MKSKTKWWHQDKKPFPYLMNRRKQLQTSELPSKGYNLDAVIYCELVGHVAVTYVLCY